MDAKCLASGVISSSLGALFAIAAQFGMASRRRMDLSSIVQTAAR